MTAIFERIKNDISNKKALMAGVHKLDMDQYAQYKRDCGKLEDERVEQEQNLKQLLYHRNYKQNWRKERSQQLLENVANDIMLITAENDMYFVDNVQKIDNEHQIDVDPFHYKYEEQVQKKTERKRQYDQLELAYQLNDAVLSGKQQKRRKRRRLNHWQIKDGAAEVGTTRN
eukprot:269397_1